MFLRQLSAQTSGLPYNGSPESNENVKVAVRGPSAEMFRGTSEDFSRLWATEIFVSSDPNLTKLKIL